MADAPEFDDNEPIAPLAQQSKPAAPEFDDNEPIAPLGGAPAPIAPAMTAQQRYRQTLKAYHDQGTENPDVAPGYVSPETSKAFAEAKSNTSSLGSQWGDVGIGAAKGLAGGVSGGIFGDIESLGRLPFQIPGVRENIADVSPHTAIPTSEEGGYLGPRGLGAFKAPETPEEKGGVFTGSLLTPFAATAPLKALRGASKLSSSAAEIVNAAERQGISIPRAAVTDNREIQTAAGYLKEIPFVGTPLVKASEKALSEIEDVAGRTVSALGSGNKLRAGDIASDAIEGWITGKSKTIATELYDAVDPLVNPEFTRPLFETKKVANEIAAKRANAKISGDSPAIREIEDALASPGMNYDGVKDLRTYIREMTPQEMVAKNINKNEAKIIYDALTTDLRATILDAGGPDALKKFDKANDVYNIIADRRASIAKVIGVSADAAPEKVIDRITAMAGNAGSADYQTLQKVRKSIGPKSWDEVSSAILAKMGRANPEAAFSADQFVTAWNKLSPSSKQLLFNSTNRPGIINDLNDIVTLSGAQKNLSKYANPSGSGKIATFAAMIPAMWTAPLPTIATIIGGRQMAKFFASPIAVKSTAQWAKANNAAFTTPNIMTTARLLSASDNIAKTLNREFGGNFSAKDFITPGQGKEPPRATGGSVFDKMHAAKHMQVGGGTDAPFNEWDAVPRNAEGIPQIRIEKPPVNEADEAQAAREAAAARVAGNVRGAPYEPTPPSTEGKTWMMEPGKEAVQSGNYEMPPNVRLNDAGIPYNVETGEELQMARRPNVLPWTRTPYGVEWAMPKIAELAGDIVNPLAVTKGVALNPGEFALGSGPIKRSVLEQPNAPTFYSALDRAVADIPQAKAPAEQWAATLANRPGVKPEEIQWRGLDQYLAGRQGQTVTKQEIADHLAGNKVELGEVKKGLPFNLKEITVKRIGEGDRSYWESFDGSGNMIVRHPGSMSEAQALDDAKNFANIGPAVETKYSGYQLPGGENYSEKLLTLPYERQIKWEKTPEGHLTGGGYTIKHEPFQDQPAYITYYGNDGRRVSGNDSLKGAQNLIERSSRGVDASKAYKSPHWDEPNPVTHMRTNERTIGNTASHHIEEVQSDWHQKGRTEGYADPAKNIAESELLTAESELKKHSANEISRNYKEAIDNQVEFHANPELDVGFAEQWFGETPEQQSAVLRYMAAKRKFSALAGGVPDAPFKKTWPDLTMKQALRDAVENGKDRLSWTPGEAQAKRYDLSKQVDSVHYNPDTQRLVAKRGNSNVIDQNGVPPDKLADYVGKDVARKIMGEEPNVNGLRSLRGENLKVGGEGMNEFYDKMLPKAVEKLGKAYGVKVQRGVDTTGNPVNYVDIPPAWKQEILKKGFPLFASGGSVFDKMKRASK